MTAGSTGASTGAPTGASTGSTRTRIVDVAFALFDDRGYDQTTVDQIAAAAGISRSTFFRMFASKEDVIFPDHDDLHRRIRGRLEGAGGDTGILAVTEAARTVLDHYLAEGDHARSRYRLTRSVAALRDREIAGMQGYQRLFREFIRTWVEPAASAELRSELMAGAVVTAHNVVLRRWLRGLTEAPYDEFDRAIAEVMAIFAPVGEAPAAVVVLRTGRTLEDVLPQLRRALED